MDQMEGMKTDEPLSSSFPIRSSGLHQALLSVSSAQKCSRAGRLATPLGVSRAARSAVYCRSSTSGHRASHSKYTRGQSREIGSLSRLFGSVETTAKCVSMDHAHCRTRLSRRSAAAFQRGHSHAGGSQAGSGNGTRSEHSPEEGGNRGGPSSRRRVRVLQPYFIVPGKGVASFFRSKQTEPPDPRTGGHEQSRRCILLPHHMKFLSLGAKRINIGFFPLALHSRPSSERMAVRQRDVILAHLKELGLRLNVRKVCFYNTENLLSGRGVGSDHDAGTYVPCSDRVNPHVSQESKRRPVTHCQAVSKLLGLMSAVSNMIHFGLLYMIPLQWRLKTKGFSPRGKSTLHDQGHAAMPTCLRHVEETLGFCLKAWCWELLFAT